MGSAWTPILSSNDPGEKPLTVGFSSRCVKRLVYLHRLLWFRELPAGVPGLSDFANMISLGKANQ
jgi:hypothetical protein